MNKSDALSAWRRGLMGDSQAGPDGAEETTPEGPGLLTQALEWTGRPVSTVMGGFFGALSPELTVGEGLRQGATGERYFSALDFLVEGGFNPDKTSTKLTALAADILNPADPLNYVGAGYTKAGKIAKGLSVAGEGAESFGKIVSRAQAAEKGLWSPLTYAGHGLLPKGVSVPVARALDAAGNRITKSKFVEALAPYLGGVKKFERQFPGISSMISGAKRALDVEEHQFVGELVNIEKGLREKGLDDGAVAKAMKDVTSLLEKPETRLVRVERELELTEDALAGKFVNWIPEALPVDEAALRSRQIESGIIERYLGASGGATETRVRLADLRKGVAPDQWAEQDAVLLRMQREGKLVLNRLDDPQEITAADHAAALMLSPDAPRHIVYLKPSALVPDESAEITQVNFANQRAVDRRVAELELGLKNMATTGKRPWEMSPAEYADAYPVRPAPPEFDSSRVKYDVFHGSPVPGIQEIATRGEVLGKNTGATNTSLGAFFSDDEEVARNVGSKFSAEWRPVDNPDATTYRARINLRNPLDLDNLTPGQRTHLETAFPGFNTQYDMFKGEKFRMLRFMAKGGDDAPMDFHDWRKAHGFNFEDAQQALGEPGSEILAAWKKYHKDSWDAYDKARALGEDGQSRLKALGYDGIVVDTVADVPRSKMKGESRNQYIVFDPENIHITQARPMMDHKGFVNFAIDSGAAVPKEVLQHYPDLASQAVRNPLDELHVLKSVQAARFAEDLPPLDVLAKRREELAGEADHIRQLWDNAGPEVLQAYDALRPLLKETRDLYEGALRKYDPNFEFPVEDYVKHMFPASYSKLTKNVLKAREAALAEKTALVQELAAQGLDDAGIERALRERMGAKLALAEGVADNRGLLKGDLDAFKQRQYNMTVEEFNKWAEEAGLDSRFENYSAAIASAMRRDASRWKFGHDIHKFILDKPGWTLGAEDYGKLSRAEQKLWQPMEFHVPWIDPRKNPFAGKYMRTEVKALVEAQMTGVGKLLTDDGLNGVLGALSGFRKWWTAWSLAPFPSSRVRDLVSDMVLANQAGLNPAVDLAKATVGESAYMASLALSTRRSKIPAVQGMMGVAPANLTNLLGKVQAKFPELTEEKLTEYMEIEGILGPSAVRDLDLAAILSNDPLMKKARGERGLGRKMLDWAPLHPNVDKSPIIKAGFGVAEAGANFTRGALFFDTLVKAIPEAKSLDDALTYATATVRRFQFDYSDLTRTERDILKNIIPFYTFSAKNVPLQITQAATDPGRLAWVNRLYQGAWNQFEEDEIQPEDLPKWLQDGMGMPIQGIQLEDGTKSYAIWTPRGWLPQTELNEMADLIRERAGSAILSRLSPVLKEPFEQMLNRDSFTMTEIEDGTIRDVMGIPMNRRAVHLINNLRLVTEVDRMDPWGLWTKIGQAMGWWQDERPHRWTAPGPERATRFFTGLNIKGVAPAQQAERNFRDAERERNAALSRAKYAIRRGQTLEAEGFMTEVRRLQTEGAASMARLNELRKRNALEVARKEAGGGSR